MLLIKGGVLTKSLERDYILCVGPFDEADLACLIRKCHVLSWTFLTLRNLPDTLHSTTPHYSPPSPTIFHYPALHSIPPTVGHHITPISSKGTTP